MDYPGLQDIPFFVRVCLRWMRERGKVRKAFECAMLDRNFEVGRGISDEK